MPISKSDQLFSLIKSLTKAEKRNFKIYAQRMSDGGALLFLQLFELLDKQKELNEPALFTKFDKSQLPNLKRHLYSQILISLKLLHRSKRVPIQIREYLDFANILYGKGLFRQSLKLLDKASRLADKLHDDVLALHILEYKKIIESRHITRTGTDNVAELTRKASTLHKRIESNIKLSNLRLILHGWYIRKGHVKSEEEAQEVLAEFNEINPNLDLNDLGLIDKAYYYQGMVWLNFMLCRFELTFEYARDWVELFKNKGGYINRDINLLMRGYHYILTSLYNLGDLETYSKYLKDLEDYRQDHYKKFNKNSQVISFIYVHNGRLSYYILSGKYKEGIKRIPRTLARLKRYSQILDSHRVFVFYFKIAWLHLMTEDPASAIKYLHKIIHTQMGNLREDIQVYARLAFLMAHYDQGNYDLMDYLIRDVKKFISKSQHESKIQDEVLSFFTKITRIPLSERNHAFEDFTDRMEELKKVPFEVRGFLYLDIIPWLEMHY